MCPIFDWYVVGFNLKRAPKRHMFVTYWIVCLNHAHHSRLGRQHEWWRSTWPLNELEARIFWSLIMNNIFIWALHIMRQMTVGPTWLYSSSCTNNVFHILQEVDVEWKMIQIRHVYLTKVILDKEMQWSPDGGYQQIWPWLTTFAFQLQFWNLKNWKHAQGVQCSSTVNIHESAQTGYYLEQACTKCTYKRHIAIKRKYIYIRLDIRL